MSRFTWTLALSLASALTLSACDRPAAVAPPVVTVAVPGPAGPAGPTGDTGAQGKPGGDGAVVVVQPAASTPSN